MPPADSRNDAEQSAPLYAEAGVDIGANDRLIPRFKALAAETSRPEVMGGVGPFSGLFDLSGFAKPVLVASTDGVGTKVLLAAMLGRLNTVGQDLVNHCVDDILTAGARPLFFLDYLANASLSEDQKVDVVAGVAQACRENGAALLGGETADMPGLYGEGAFDLAGTIVGVVEKGHEITPADVVAGDVLFGLPSTGLHTNGYSLVRSIFDLTGDDPQRDRAILEREHAELGESLGAALLRVHQSYWPALEPVLFQTGEPLLKGIAHITGGGLPGNLARILPEGTQAVLDAGSWPRPPVFALIQRSGEISDGEMSHVFNLGLGLILAVDPTRSDELRSLLPRALEIGRVGPGDGADPVVLR